MIDLKKNQIWFLTGSQHLYGPDALKTVDEHSQAIVAGLSRSSHVPVDIVFKPVLTTPDAIFNVCLQANSTPACVGVVAWMHTFSPAKMWIAGLKVLNKPLLDLHT